MIESWANSATRQLATTGKCKFSGLDEARAIELLTVLNAAPSLKAISPLKSVNLHPLKGSRKGQWSISVNGPWRICFRFHDGNAFDVEITNYH
jgi:proteic killer suppression protein